MEDGTPHFDCRFPNRHCKGKSESFTGTLALIKKIMNPYSPTSRMSVSIALRQFGYITTAFLSNFRTALVRSWPTWSLRITYSNLMLDCKISTVKIGIWKHLSTISFENNLLGCPRSWLVLRMFWKLFSHSWGWPRNLSSSVGILSQLSSSSRCRGQCSPLHGKKCSGQ